VWPILFWLWTTTFMGWKTPADDRAVLLSHREEEDVENVKNVANDSPNPGTKTEAGDLQVLQTVEEEKTAVPDRTEQDRQSSMEERGDVSDQPIPLEFELQEQQSQHDSARFRTCLYALCVGECLVILLSYLSSFPTIEEMGMSAAYFSTWSRCGDFACGGFVYIIVHLNPAIRRRYKREDGLEPMTFQFRVWCEVGVCLSFLISVLPPMLQFPLDDMLHFYFHYYRIPFSFFAISFTVPGALQSSEPLPSWAIFSRLLNHPAMAMLGMISYGVYLFHWPIILWFGEPMNHQAFEERAAGTYEGAYEYSTAQLLRDHGIAAFSIFCGVLSFFLFEFPLLKMASKVKRPWKVIALGLYLSFNVAGVVLLCTPDAKDPNGQGDWGNLAAKPWNGQSADQTKFAEEYSSAPPLPGPAVGWSPVEASDGEDFGDSVSDPAVGWSPVVDIGDEVMDDDGKKIEDNRFTPIGFVTPTYSGMSIASILDKYTMPIDSTETYLNYERHNKYGDGWPRSSNPAQVFSELSERAGPKTILFVCRTIVLRHGGAQTHPCDHDWAPDVTWVWVQSNLLCAGDGESKRWLDEEQHGGPSNYFHDKHCDNLKTKQLRLPSEMKWETDPDSRFANGHTYSGRQDRDAYLLQEMILLMAMQHSAIFNHQSIATMRASHKEGKEWIEYLEQYVQEDGTFDMPETHHGQVIRQLVMGESVAYKIGVIAKEQVQASLPCEDGLKASGVELLPFPFLEITNLGAGGEDTIAHFIPCQQDCQANPSADGCSGMHTYCFKLSRKESDYRNNVRTAIQQLEPHQLVIMDAHFQEPGRVVPEPDENTWMLALESMLRTAERSGVKETIFFTTSPLKHNSLGEDGQIHKFTHAYHQVIQRYRCDKVKRGRGMHFTLFKWHELICPQWGDLDFDAGDVCQQEQHGFQLILGDLVHPKGPSGDWLVGNTWRAFVEMYAELEMGLSQEQIANIGFVRCMLQAHPPDNDPVLADIMRTEKICMT